LIGITSFGGYLPRRRLNRESAFQAMGWYATELAAYRNGERSFGNADEDALTMAVEASRDCLKEVDRQRIGGLFVASTTLPYSDRLNAGILKEALGLSDEVSAADVTSSQRAGTTALLTALSTLSPSRGRTILVTASDNRLARSGSALEMCCGDGAASVLVGRDNVVAEFVGARSLTRDFVDHYRAEDARFDYVWEERWVRSAGYAEIIPEVLAGLLDKHALSLDELDKIIYPCVSPAEHRNIAKRLGVSDKVEDNLFMTVGETGAAHPLVMLVRALETAGPGDLIAVIGFGSGADALCFRVTENIAKLPARKGIAGFLGAKHVEDNYNRFLKLRDLIDVETGIRREAPQKTALSVLWRHREMLLGLVGGICEACGTPQFPRTRFCVNPECRAKDSQSPYRFADRTAVIKTYTADHLGPSVNPPSYYGLIQFEGGGRMMAEFTDCALEDLWVGGLVEMRFRRRYVDPLRGFRGYFWKAVPVRGGEA
jgi:3-hydroxy-3-methylglutaryl CoA synthase